MRYPKQTISAIVGIFVTLFGFNGALTKAGALQDSRESERAYLRVVASDLVLSQTGSTDKNERSRLCDGDRILKWNDITVRDNDHLVELWLATAADETTQITVERNNSGDELELLVIPYEHSSAAELFAPLQVGNRTEYRDPEDLFPDLEALVELPLRQAALETLDDDQLDDARRLAEAFRRLTDEVTGYYRSDHIVYLLNRPFHCEAWSRKYCDLMAGSEGTAKTIDAAWQLADPLGDALPEVKENSNDESWESFADLILSIETRVREIRDRYAAAIIALDDSERLAWQGWCREFRPVWAGDESWPAFSEGFQLTKKIDRNQLSQAIALAAQLTDDLSPGGVIYSAVNDLVPDDLDSVASDFVSFGTSESDVHRLEKPITIDFAGDDRYTFPTSGLDDEFPVRFILDFAGNDRYDADKNGIAAGVGGISVLIDVAGDDEYVTRQNGIGYAVCGMGLLLDVDGHDRYFGQVFSQGAACLGVGMVIDRSGNDRYDAAHYSQGIGLPAGCGAIVDLDGDDVYTCTGKAASPYGDAGEYNGMGQGCGLGFRRLGSGGVGLIVDAQGSDFYRAGQFGLGCGYFYGIGVVNDRAGNDVFECSRYGLGTAAHYGIGIVLDDLGDDIYLANRAAAVAEMGSAWDLGLGALIDSGGNDTYNAVSYALAGSAQNAYGFFWDKAGDDTYRSQNSRAGEALGYAGNATYGAGRGARNLSIFLDEGSGEDVYRTAGRSNDQQGIDGEYGVWIDR